MTEPLSLSRFYAVGKACLLLGVLMVVAGCATNVRTKISTFRDPSASIGQGRIAVEAQEEAKRGSLEFKFYKEKLEQRLTALGYQIDETDPTHIARLAYGVNRQEAEQRGSGKVVVGTSIGAYRGWHHTGLFFTDDYEKEFEYERLVTITIARAGEQDSETSQNLLEISARSVGNCESLPVVYDAMLDAIFKDVQRANGSMVTVSVPSESRC